MAGRRASASGDGGQHDDDVAVADRRAQALEEADVLVVDVDVDEAAQVLALDQAVLDARVPDSTLSMTSARVSPLPSTAFAPPV